MNELHAYLEEMHLPNPSLLPNKLSNLFLCKKISTYWDAISYVHSFKYGRNQDRAQYHLVPKEKKGTCSTKHALLAALSQELEVPLKLTMGIFLMNEQNTSGIGQVLDRYKPTEIPEAHCYLKYEKKTLDITFSNSVKFECMYPIAREIVIRPEQIGLPKIKFHQQFMLKWLKSIPHLDFETAWKAREECIEILTSLCNGPPYNFFLLMIHQLY